jgi:hypothetical protein
VPARFDTPILPIATVTHAALKIRVKHSHPSANETCPYPSADTTTYQAASFSYYKKKFAAAPAAAKKDKLMPEQPHLIRIFFTRSAKAI